MAHLISLSIDATKITKSRMDGKYVNITINISDEVDKYGNNVAAWESQSKEERDSKAKRSYIGNGRVLYTQGEVLKPDGNSPAPATKSYEDDMPF